MKWISFEPHTHTVHSDAAFTVEALLAQAGEEAIDAIALTDHNTDTGLDEIPAEQVAPRVVPGIEWTTFYGHVVLLAPERFVEWRALLPDTLNVHLDLAHAANAVVVMAHPFDVGEPLCCGCRWTFDVPHWEKLDAMEVWSSVWPPLAQKNMHAYALWCEKLREGYRTTALTARDWHDVRNPEPPCGVNYICIDERLPFNDAVKAAVRKGACYMTMGPTLTFSLEANGVRADMGDVTAHGSARITIVFDGTQRSTLWERYDIIPERVTLFENDCETVLPFPGYGKPITLDRTLAAGFVRVELAGTIMGRASTLLISNPIFVE